MKRTFSVVAAVLVGAAMLAACKGDSRTTIFAAPTGGIAPGYKPGTPVTLLDGTPVTLPNGTPVTTPTFSSSGTKTTSSGSKSNGSDGLDNASPAAPVTPGGGGTSPTTIGSTTATSLQTTGTTSVTAVPNQNHLAVPKAGTYKFSETDSSQGGSPSTSDIDYALAVSGPQVKWQVLTAGTVSPDYYTESHDSDGLFLVASGLSGLPCGWSPKVASLPQSVVDGGKPVTTSSTCTATSGSNTSTYNLDVTISFKDLVQVKIGNTAYPCIQVNRHRVLTQNAVVITSDAVDTYTFALGIRIATSEYTTSTNGSNGTFSTRDLSLTALP